MVTPDRCTEEARDRILAEELSAVEKRVDRTLLRHDWSEGACLIAMLGYPDDWRAYFVEVGRAMGWGVADHIVYLLFEKP